jgi:PAS domain S-box-containing protein
MISSRGVASLVREPEQAASMVFRLVALAGLYALGRCNFLVFHCLTEAFSVGIGIAVFAIFWNTRQFLQGGAYLIVGFGCLAAGTLDLVYIFAYPGMSVFPGDCGNLAFQAKTVAQWFVSFSVLCAFAFLHRKVNEYIVFAITCGIAAAALATIFAWPIFPDCLVAGGRFTVFQRVGLAVSCSVYLAAIALLLRNRGEFNPHVLTLLVAALTAFAVEDCACAVARDVNGTARTLGHLCQVVAMCLVYKAFVELGLTRPYAVLFHSQQQAAAALERQQQFLESVLDQVEAGIIACDAEGIVTLFNRAMREFHGPPQSPIPADRWGQHHGLYQADGVTPLTMEEVPLYRALNGQRFQAWEMVVAPQAGPRRTYMVSGAPVRGKQGENLGAVIALHDITGRKRSEEELRQSEERYRLLVETVPHLAWRCSADGLEIDCNARWYEYTGQTPAQVRGHGWLAAVHPDDLFRVTEAALHAAVTKEPYHAEYRLRRGSDGSYRWHLARSVPVLDQHGNVAAWFGSATDVEELKQSQEILKLANDEQLQRHQAELAHVGRLSMMGEMAASLAHELNQPLHAVANYAYGSTCRLQKSSQPDPQLLTALEQIREEAQRAAEIIRRIKAFVQKRTLRFSQVALGKLVTEAALFARSDFDRSRAKLVLHLADDLPAIEGDPIQLEQVLMNLLRNSLESMEQTPADERLVTVKTQRNGPDAVELSVCDNGKGICPADCDKIFEPFFTTKPEGMGMGLAISRSIIQAHRGRLWVSCDQPRGCTFHITLPVGTGSMAHDR